MEVLGDILTEATIWQSIIRGIVILRCWHQLMGVIAGKNVKIHLGEKDISVSER